MRAVDVIALARQVESFNPNQLRAPAGSGAGGRWIRNLLDVHAPTPGKTEMAHTAGGSVVAMRPAVEAPHLSVTDAEVEDRVRTAYTAVAGTGTRPKWVKMVELRGHLGGLDRAQVDDVLRTMNRTPGVSIVPEPNQKVLTEADRAAAVMIGNQPKHAILIDLNAPRAIARAVPPKPASIVPAARATVRSPTRRTPDLAGERGSLASLRDDVSALRGELVARLRTAKSREDAMSSLNGLTVAELRAVAKETGASLTGASTKDAIRGRVVEHTVGFRLNSATIRGGTWGNDPAPHADTTAALSRLPIRRIRQAAHDANIDIPAGRITKANLIRYLASTAGERDNRSASGSLDRLRDAAERLAASMPKGRTR